MSKEGIMMKNERLYSNARKILTKAKVNEFNVFIEYFLHTIESDLNFVKNIGSENFDFSLSENVLSKIKNYNDKVNQIHLKTNIVSNWKNLPSFQFFQFVMANKDAFIVFEKYNLEDLKSLNQKLKNKQIKECDAIVKLDIPNSIFSKFEQELNRMENNDLSLDQD